MERRRDILTIETGILQVKKAINLRRVTKKEKKLMSRQRCVTFLMWKEINWV